MRKLGRFPILSLSDARVAARKFFADPEAVLKQEAGNETFEQVLDKFVLRHIKAKVLGSAKDYESTSDGIAPSGISGPSKKSAGAMSSRFWIKSKMKSAPAPPTCYLAHISKLCNWYAGRSDDLSDPDRQGHEAR
jgi:hypothetical protein